MNTISGFRQLLGPLLLLLLILVIGTVGYMVIEKWPFLDALFMTVITVTTVGYGQVHPLSRAGEIFTIFLIILGVGGVFYTLTALFGWLLSIDWPEEQRRRQVRAALKRLENHFIICGYGRVGRTVAEVLRRERCQIVVIDVNQASLVNAEADGYLTVHGNAASDEVLIQAGVQRARGLITAVDSDADNVYVVLSARGLRPDLLIIGRASSEDAIRKLKRAGATHAISPYTTAGKQMAMLALRPRAVEWVETLLHGDHERLELEEVLVEPGSALSGARLEDLRRRPGLESLVIEVRHAGRLLQSPPDDYVLEPGDELILIGTSTQLRQIEKLT